MLNTDANSDKFKNNYFSAFSYSKSIEISVDFAPNFILSDDYISSVFPAGSKLMSCIVEINKCLFVVPDSAAGEDQAERSNKIISDLKEHKEILGARPEADTALAVGAAAPSTETQSASQFDPWHLKQVQADEAWKLVENQEEWYGIGMVDWGVNCEVLHPGTKEESRPCFNFGSNEDKTTAQP